ncbi:MAG: hypothetical protein HYS19_02160 [Nitrosomonadales bacterium]|nr:hypothetical protein [Nitrosomonadales bacterium]
MKKIVLSLASVLAATAFAPEASAIPAFARQTGMACNACHQQHFPVLNSFGMAFKASGYTMMGSQGKIEAEHMSIPDTLNMSMLIKARYQDTNGTDAVGTLSGQTTNGGQWQIPDEFALFAGGRVAENIGVFTEINVAGTQTAGGAVVAGFKLPFSFDVGGAQLGVIPFTAGAGPAFGFELSSQSLTSAIRWSEDRVIQSANQIGLNTVNATGLALVARNDMGYINFTRWSPNFTASGASSIQLRSNWLRIAATPTVADWNMHIGLGVASGTNYTATGTVFTQVDTKATVLDFQGQTQLGGKDFSLYANYARAPGTAAGALVANLFNANVNAQTAWVIGADYSVIPNTLHIGGAIKRGDNGLVTLNKDNAIMVQGIYDLAQNVALHLVHTKHNGSSWDLGGVNRPTVSSGALSGGDSLTTFMLEAAW